jgi:hypothetical protein
MQPLSPHPPGADLEGDAVTLWGGGGGGGAFYLQVAKKKLKDNSLYHFTSIIRLAHADGQVLSGPK